MNKTIFIIGAGASAELGLPTGERLKNQIADLLNIQYDFQQTNGDRTIGKVLQDRFTSKSGDYVKVAWHIRDALPQAISIDNFIDSQRETEQYEMVVLCAKLAIVRAILIAEKKSILLIESHEKLDYNALRNTWYTKFFKIITENCNKRELEERFKSLVLIIYNYDRCIEHYLYHALQNYYQTSSNEAAALVKHITIYHPYGSVGELPLYESDSNKTIAYGTDPNANQLYKLIDQIKTFAEGIDPRSSEIEAIKKHMSEADKLVFLGFAFHKLNMKILTANHNGEIRKITYGTAFEFSENNIAEIKKQIQKLFGNKVTTLPGIYIKDVTCSKFFDEYWKGLAFK